MNIAEALIRLHAMQTYRRIVEESGKAYGPGLIRRRNWVRGVQEQENRRVSLRLSKMPCIKCGTVLSASSTGDHIVPLTKGGPAGAQNYLPLCGKCNASKGSLDLLFWWQKQGRSVADLPHDVICAYARLAWQHVYTDRLEEEAPEFLHQAVSSLLATLPVQCQKAINEIAYRSGVTNG